MTEPYFRDAEVTVYGGDCVQVMKTLADNSVDAVVTDPPYNLAFMSKAWDALGGEFQDWCQVWASECLRILKPGGHIAAFGGTRTWHRLACGIEDAGFEIRDNLAWLYGSGFPKGLDVSKAIDKALGAERQVIGTRTTGLGTGRGSVSVIGDSDNRDITAPATDAAKKWQGWSTALKPAFEPVVLARKPLRGSVASNVLEHGTGAMNVAACRVGDSGGGNSCAGGDACHCDTNAIYGATKHPVRPEGDVGRWPPNVLLDEHAASVIDHQSGYSRSRRSVLTSTPGEIYGGGKGLPSHTGTYGHDDEGGASRFFPVFPFRYTPKASTAERPSVDGTAHPTVKPVEIMRWLIRLITPPGGVVLDPFGGSGATAEAAIHEHRRAILIEREPSYLPLIAARLSKPMAIGFDFEEGA